MESLSVATQSTPRSNTPPYPPIRVFLLPGGMLPQRMSAGAAGFDVYVRAVVSATELDGEGRFRRTLFDFESLPDPNVDLYTYYRVIRKPDGSLAYRLNAGERVTLGIGFATEFPFPEFFWVSPRSGLASKQGITIGNAPGTIDADYRGEACVVLINGNVPSPHADLPYVRSRGTRIDFAFDITRGMRVAQALFGRAGVPELQLVEHYDALTASERGSGGLGSTGLIDHCE